MATYVGSGPLRAVKLVAIAIISSTICMYISHMLSILGVGKEYASVNTTSCRQVGHGVLRGCEDIVVDPHTGLAYLACGSLAPRQHWLHPDDEYDFSHEAEVDRVYVMSEDDSFAEVRLVEAATNDALVPFGQDLRLHGFDIWWDPKDPRMMTFFFVNHQLDHAAVSIFAHTRGADHMVHVETVKSDLLASPNNVLAMSERSFYATNDVKYTRGIMRRLSPSLRLPDGHVVHRSDTGEVSIAASGIRYPNGIARHGDWIYVASCTDPGVQIYRAGPDHSLVYQGRTVFPDSIPDNLFVDPATGQIYSTTFLKVGETHRFFKSPSLETTRVAGTKVLRLTQHDNPKAGFAVENVLIDSGELMPSATVAAIQRRNQVQRMLIGCVMCDFLTICDPR
ncbi:hypothetical protein GGF46_001094 [Coemansia sp. RSA 552]|nr:hypothetical protein GGF46_001094 [Coemansia sp. RSA 552]